MRECSRYRPTTLRTVIFSVYPATPGRRQQMPRMKSSVRTPARDARMSAVITPMSFMELTLIAMRPASPFAVSTSMSSSTQER